MVKKNQKYIFVQARLGSTRFPNKVLQKIGSKSIIEIIKLRLDKIKDQFKLVFLIPQKDKNLKKFLIKKNILFFSGSASDVLSRYHEASKKFNAKHIVRITADCPLVDPILINEMFKMYENENCDYLSNIQPPTFPDGYDIEIFNNKILKDANDNSKNKYEREHVTPYMQKNSRIKKLNFINSKDLSHLRLTLDYKKDLIFLKKLFKQFKRFDFSYKDVQKKFFKNKTFFLENILTDRNEKNLDDNNQKLWTKSKKIIPGGNSFFSKHPKNFIEYMWPTYFQKTRSSFVWDLNNKKYIDLYAKAVGTNILGYNNRNVDKKVIENIKKGNTSSLNCLEEVQLAEKLIKLHPWADMVKFARTGAEANNIALRIARAASKKDKIIVCGYHGWNDWYLSANLTKKNSLDTHLQSNLQFAGVPKNLKGSVFSFKFNDLIEFKKILSKNKDIGVLFMEVFRNEAPKKTYLKKLLQICKKNKIVVIFDECTSGFRETFGGIHLKFKVNPDIAVFGKALGNGYAITAIIGKKDVMKYSEKSFLSSTFWSERIGPTAALATLNEMEKLKSWVKITKIGKNIKKRLYDLARKNKVGIIFQGLDSLINFNFTSKANESLKKIVVFEMLNNGILAKNLIYVSLDLNAKILKRYFSCMKIVMKKIYIIEKYKY